jgi:hypothetical protein
MSALAYAPRLWGASILCTLLAAGCVGPFARQSESPVPAPGGRAERPLPDPGLPGPGTRPEPVDHPELDTRVVATVGPPASGGPVPLLPGAILPRRRLVAFDGNPASERRGVQGELTPERRLERLDREVAAWERADPETPVQPALHMMTTVAAGDPGPDSLYRTRMSNQRIAEVKEWADRRGALLFLDIQPGRSTVQAELPRLREWLARPDVHLALDPEWNMGRSGRPGHTIGSMSAAEINFAIAFLADLVEEHDLPPKILVVHRFTRPMVRGAKDITLDPRVQLVLHMDGWGPPAQKLNTYRSIVAPEAAQFTGFKLFYKNDVRDGSRMLRPEEILALRPIPFYIQYQ